MLSRIFQFALVACLATGPLWAQTDPFVGQWKLVKLTDQMTVTNLGANKYAFDFGGDAETIVADGTDQPANAGTTLSVAANGPNWKVIRKKGSRTLLSATWTLSKDGNLLTDDFTVFGQNGSPSNIETVYERKAVGSGFAGTWLSMTTALNSVIMLQVRPYESNGLSFIIPSQGQTINVNFDGKDYLNADTGSSSSAQRLNARAVEIIRKSKGAITRTQMNLSPDLKTLTMIVRTVGKDEPKTYVFERQ